MVTVLTTIMIVGVVIVIGLLVTRLSRDTPVLPDQIALPDGAKPVAFTQGAGWYAVVTDGDEILIFDRLTGALKQTVVVE